MSTPRPRTDTIQIEVDVTSDVMTDTARDHLNALTGYLVDVQGALLVRPSGNEQWTGSIRTFSPGEPVYEAVSGTCPEHVLAQLRGRVGA